MKLGLVLATCIIVGIVRKIDRVMNGRVDW